ncbi:MAG: hypothetical protein QG622_1975 [Actinomycetota bacterium]|nr:hypothetical protein [Actinomycetota bacterium]
MTSQTFTTVVTDGSWMRGLRPGHLVELLTCGEMMIGKVLHMTSDDITVSVPVDEQPDALDEISLTGTAVISIDGAAARVPVRGEPSGESVRLRFTGPAEIIQRRLHVRVLLAVPVRFVWQSSVGGPWHRAESLTVDISIGGVRIAPGEGANGEGAWPSVGQHLEIALDLPSGTVLERATVIGTTPDNDLRLTFSSIGEETREAIDFLTHCSPLAP